MPDQNPFRRTFLRSYWAQERGRARAPLEGLLNEALSGVTEDDFYQYLDLGLRVRRPGSPPDEFSYADDLFLGHATRIVLFDLVGSGKRTVARRLFRRSLSQIATSKDPEYLPCWLPGDPSSASGSDLIKLIAKATSTGSNRFEAAQVESWLKYGPPPLLFLELDRFQVDREFLLGLSDFLEASGQVGCVITCHSNLGDRPDFSGKGFDYYEVERPNEVHLALYSKSVAKIAGRPRNSLATEASPASRLSDAMRKMLSDGRMLPQILHLLCTHPGARGEKTMARVFEVVEREIFNYYYNNLRSMRLLKGHQHEMFSKDDYHNILGRSLGRIALSALYLNQDKAGGPPASQGLSVDGTTLREVVRCESWELITGELHREAAFGRSSMPGEVELSEKLFTPTLLRSMLFLKCHKKGSYQFVGNELLAYFAGVFGLVADAKIPKGQEWCEVVVELFARWSQLSPLVAEFLAGVLEEGDLAELLLSAIAREPGEIVSASRLEQSIDGLCRGADSTFAVPAALLEGHARRAWHSSHDPRLLPSELHALLLDRAWWLDRDTGLERERHRAAAEKTRAFASALARRLEDGNRPWLERVWPFPIDTGPSAEHGARVTALHLIGGGRSISADSHGNVLVWDWELGRRLTRTLHEGRIRVLGDLKHGDRHYIVSAGDDRTISLWDPGDWSADPGRREKGARMTQPILHAGKVLALAVVADPINPCIVSAGEEGIVYFWYPFHEKDRDRLRVDRINNKHMGSVTSLSRLARSNLVASGGEDGRVRVWTIAGGSTMSSTVRNPGKTRSRPVTALIGDSINVVWGDDLGRVFFCPTAGEPVVTIRHRHTKAVTALLITDGGFVSGGQDGIVYEWGWNSDEPKQRAGHRAAIRGIERAGEHLVCGWADGKVEAISPRKRQDGTHPGRLGLLRAIDAKDEDPTYITAGERLVCVGTSPYRLDSPVSQIRHRGQVSAIALGDSFFLSGGSDGSVMLFDLPWNTAKGGREPRRRWPTHHRGPVSDLMVRGPRFVTAGRDGRVWVWQGDADALHMRAEWGGAPVTAAWIGGEGGNIVAWGEEDGSINRYDLITRKNIVLRRHPDGKVLGWLDDGQAIVATRSKISIFDLDFETCQVEHEAKNASFPRVSQGDRWIAYIDEETGEAHVIWNKTGESHAIEAGDFGRDMPSKLPTDRRVTVLHFVGDDLLLVAERRGTVRIVRLFDGASPRVLGGYPIGIRVTAMAGSGANVLVGLSDGRLVALRLHTPAPGPTMPIPLI